MTQRIFIEVTDSGSGRHILIGMAHIVSITPFGDGSVVRIAGQDEEIVSLMPSSRPS